MLFWTGISVVLLPQADHTCSRQVLGPEPKGLLHGSPSGAGPTHRPVGVGGPHRGCEGVWLPPAERGGPPQLVPQYDDVNQFISHQHVTRVGT